MHCVDFEGTFIEDIKQNIPAAQFLASALDDITESLSSFLDRARLAISASFPEQNTTAIFVAIVGRIEAAIRASSFLTAPQQECLVMQVNRHLNQTGLVVLGRTLRTVQRSFTAVTRIVSFLGDFARDLDDYIWESFPSQCLRRLLELSVCGRCTQRIPPLCSNTCGAIVRGCFAGFYSGLRREFDALWSVLRQLVERVEASVRELFAAENRLLDVNVSCVHV